MAELLIGGTLKNFSVIMLLVAVVLAVAIGRPWRAGSGPRFNEELFRWTALLATGSVGIFAGVMHVLFPDFTSKSIGWGRSPFEFEVGMADLAIGVVGVMAFRASLGFRTATTIVASIFLGGDALGHIYQMVAAHNFAPGNAGGWFWTDILVPLVLVATLVKLRRRACPTDGPTLACGRSGDIHSPRGASWA